jgi:putative spermidine/putrescine transport system substrate-binding protein
MMLATANRFGVVTRRRVLSGAGAAALAGTLPFRSAHAAEALVATMYGGEMERGWRRNVVDPFEKRFNAAVTIATGTSLDNLAKMRAQKNDPQIDVVCMDPIAAIPAANEGLYEELDRSRIPVIDDLYDWAVSKYHLSWLSVYYGLCYNTKKIKEPTSWNDLWNPAYKGHVIFPDISNGGSTLMMHVFNTIAGGDTNRNEVKAGWERVKSLKPQILTFWTSHDQVAQLLSQGDAWIAPWPTDRLLTLKAQGAPVGIVIPKEGVPFSQSEIGIAKGSKHRELAEKYINFALSPEQQKKNSETIWIGPTNKKVQLAPELAKDLGVNPPPGTVRIPVPDWGRIAAYREEWINWWNREIRG